MKTDSYIQLAIIKDKHISGKLKNLHLAITYIEYIHINTFKHLNSFQLLDRKSQKIECVCLSTSCDSFIL